MITLEKIYRDNKKSVFAHVLSVVKNYHDSEEVTEDVFLKIMRLNENPKTRFNPELSALTTWIRTITNSVILDYFRTNHQDKYKAVSDFVDSEGNDVFNFVAPAKQNADSQILTAELQSVIIAAFHGLKQNYRRVATLYFIRGYEYSEIAEMLDIPMGTVKGMLSRSREKLQAALKGVYNLRSINVQVTEEQEA